MVSPVEQTEFRRGIATSAPGRVREALLGGLGDVFSQLLSGLALP